MKVREIMTPRMESVSAGLSLRAAALKMRERDVGSLAVWDGQELVGIITDRDICCRGIAEGFDPEKATVRQIMSTDVAFCFSDDDVAAAAHLMETRHVRRLAVLTRDKRVAGFLTVDDVARYSHHLAGVVLEAAQPMH